ncbi:MAG: response regulator transcription factor [Gloeobacteraceae cyanobacterium ES-bin-316]|nr:response regulator transcription factor [Ferruginibacter sp.]
MQTPCLNILVVDDSPLVIQRLFQILNETDCVETLYEANSYYQAVEVLKNKQLDIVLLDIQIPGKNGIELLGFIRKNYPSVITIMLTNKVSASYKDLCQSMGCNHFVDKSSEFESIAGILESYIAV